MACSNKYYEKIEKKDIVFHQKIIEKYYGVLTNEEMAYIIDDNDIIIAEMQLKSYKNTTSSDRNIDYCIFEHPDYQDKSFVIGNILNENISYLSFSDRDKIKVDTFENIKFFFKITDSKNLVKNYILYDVDGEIID